MRKKFTIAFGINLVLLIVGFFISYTDLGRLIYFISTGVFIITLLGALGAPKAISKKFNKRAVAVVRMPRILKPYYRPQQTFVPLPFVITFILTYQTEQGQFVTVKMRQVTRKQLLFSRMELPIRYNEKKPHQVALDTEPPAEAGNTREPVSPYQKIYLVSLVFGFVSFMIFRAASLFDIHAAIGPTRGLLCIGLFEMTIGLAGLTSFPQKNMVLPCFLLILLNIFLLRNFFGYL